MQASGLISGADKNQSYVGNDIPYGYQLAFLFM